MIDNVLPKQSIEAFAGACLIAGAAVGIAYGMAKLWPALGVGNALSALLIGSIIAAEVRK